MLSLFLYLIDDPQNICKFELLYNQYHGNMYNIAFGITHNQHDAEDALQDALFSIAEDIDRIKTDNAFMLKSYLYKITKNAAIDVLRRRKHRGNLINIDELINLSSNEDISYSIEGDEQYRRIVNTILTMPATYRDVLVLHFLREMSTSQISRVLHRRHSTVKGQLHRGAKLLRKVLKEVGIDD